MSRINTKTALFILVIICSPVSAWAHTRDGGVVDAFLTLVYLLIIFVLMFAFIIYSIVKLKSKKEPKEKQGRKVFIISIASFIPTVLIPIYFINKLGWASGFVKAWRYPFLVIILLTIASVVSGRLVMKRSKKS